MPNEVEPAPPVNMNEVCKFWVFVYIKSSSTGRKKILISLLFPRKVLTGGGIACFALGDFDCDLDVTDSDDDFYSDVDFDDGPAAAWEEEEEASSGHTP